jgi:hypothetical protein
MELKTYNSVSKLQFPMLRDFCSLAPGTYVSLEEAAELDQRPFGSLYNRGWLAHRLGRGFHATAEGRKAYQEYVEAESRHRKRPDLPLSHYFDPIVYQLKPGKVKGAA